MNHPQLNPQNSFIQWTRNFNQKVTADFPSGPRVLVGYSLGGRLALHALADQPNLYDAVILISVNPGLVREKDRQARWQTDLQWAEKFQQLSWQELLQEWNAQTVFKDSLSEPKRAEEQYDRSQLAAALTEWSLSKQADFRELIISQQEKIFWLSGDNDIKFLSLAMELQKRAPGLRAESISQSSHRVLFDNPTELAGKMIEFLRERY